MFHDKKERCLPKADACFNRLILSTVSVTMKNSRRILLSAYHLENKDLEDFRLIFNVYLKVEG